MGEATAVAGLHWSQVRAFRLARQGLLERGPAARLLETVRSICGVQAQVQSAAELQLWARLEGLGSADVRRALWEDRTLVRTWCMRGTLHLLAADELPLYVAALRTHDRWWKGAWLRMIDCSVEELRAILDAIADSLDGSPLTREQLADEVGRRVGMRTRDRMLSGWAEMLKPAAFAGRLISGPPQGQNVTFVRPDRWLASWKELDTADGWRQVVRRYLGAYGPASREDFARWWGMQPAAAGRVLKAAAAELVEVSVEGHPAWALRRDVAELALPPAVRPVRLLPAFDPYVLGTRPRQVLVDRRFEDRVFRQAGWISPVVLIGGVAAGVWSYELDRPRIRIEIQPFRKLDTAEMARIAEEAALLGEYFDSVPALSYRG